ncbi:ParB/RepB/Spo0J family partition protein [Micromonospora sp. NPDC051300]|uniref:ParB/RepB/Spo0J family partition protein n=1 Tax=Micromonospora sp. NPDC051300 TaxID=3364286 RepID=UPI0037B1E09A
MTVSIEDHLNSNEGTDSQESSPVLVAPMRPESTALSDVITHPANPRKVLGDLGELEASIREVGVIQPPVVLPAGRVAAAWPKHAKEIADAKWVVLVGARRRTAAGRVYGGDPEATLNVLVREDAIADDPLAQLDVMTAENVARAPLSPVEEARAFAEQEAAGRKQRDIAAKVGCSQSHVSKRLKLLKLPEAMLAALETSQRSDDDQGDAQEPALQIKDALAFVDAAGGDQELTLAAYQLRDDRRAHWSAANLVNEVQRIRERQATIDAAGKKLAAEGTPVIADPIKQFGNDYWQRRLTGAKAIAAARKAGELAAGVDSYGAVTYYSTGRKPKAADNRSPAEQQRITDDRERRKAMTARAEAAAVLAAKAPKLPPAAADIIDAWLFAPGSECAQLAHKWLLAAEVGPDPALPNYHWWEKVRHAGWHTRVHAAHALALARREVQARGTYRSWTHSDAGWLHRLTTEAGYTPSAWEQARLAAIEAPDGDTNPGQPDAGERDPVAPPERVSLSYDGDDACCWLLHYDLRIDEPAAYGEHLTDPDDVDAAKAWAVEVLADRHRIEVTGWTDGQVLPGRPAYLAAHAGDPATAADGSGSVGEWRLLFALVDGAWLVLADDKPHADHDGLTAASVDQACQWASGVLADAGVTCYGWTARADGATLEYVADLTGQC